MTTLLVGFDSAWTVGKSGAVAGLLRTDDGEFVDLGPPRISSFTQAGTTILEWQASHQPTRTLILIDQPTVVKSQVGKQRSVEKIVCSPVSRRYGGVQPAHPGREEMFGSAAPLWNFLERFGGAADPLHNLGDVVVLETYPVLTLISLGWLLPDSRATGKLPKYNPDRKKTFSISSWQYVCQRLSHEFQKRGIENLSDWLEGLANLTRPTKPDQDRVDACICLLVALCLSDGADCLMVGTVEEGYMVVPFSDPLAGELRDRCLDVSFRCEDWVRSFKWG